jgi:hypothetical protein
MCAGLLTLDCVGILLQVSGKAEGGVRDFVFSPWVSQLHLREHGVGYESVIDRSPGWAGD